MNINEIRDFLLKNKYSQLLAVLLFFFFSSPFIPERERGLPLFTVLFIVSMLLVLKSIGVGKRVYLVSLVFGTAAFALELVLKLFPGMNDYLAKTLMVSVGAIYGIFILLAIIVIARELFSGSSFDMDAIRGAVAVYMLMGFLGMIVYSILDAVEKASFLNFVPGGNSNFLYYSFVTMTTIGYGDIVPVSRLAQTFSAAQAVTGQMYMAIVVARLVGKHIAFSKKDDR